MYLMYNGQLPPFGANLTGYQVSTPQVNKTVIDPPGVRGLIRTGKKYANRAITLHFVLNYENMAHAAMLFQDLCSWCASDEPAPLILPGMEDRYILAECTNFPIPDWSKREQEFDVTFDASSPDFQAYRESSKTITAESPRFRIGGNLPVAITIIAELDDDQTDIVFKVDDYVIELAGQIPDGIITIKTGTLAQVMDGTRDVTALVTLESDIDFTLSPGLHTLTLPDAISTATVTWRNAWI